MKRLLIIIGVITGMAVFMIGCSSVLEEEKENPIDVLVSYSGTLVGDASSVVNISYILPGGEDVKQVALQTAEEPYEISVVYGLKDDSQKTDEQFERDWTEGNTKRAFLYNSLAYFILVDNVDQVTFSAESENSYKFMVTREQMEQFIGKSLTGYAENADLWKAEIEEGIINNSEKTAEFYTDFPLQ